MRIIRPRIWPAITDSVIILMKVLLVSSKYPPEYSGSGNRAHKTYLSLQNNYGIDFQVICSSVEMGQSDKYEVDDVVVHRIVSERFRKINQLFGKGHFRRLTNAWVYHSEYRSVMKILAKKDFDLIHVFGYSPATIAAINWSRNHSIPLVLEIVNNIINPYQYLPGTRWFKSYDLSKQSVIVAISNHLAELCETVGLSTNVWTRPNPVDINRFTPASFEKRKYTIKQNFSFDNSDTVIVYIAKFMKQKNHEFLLEVMKHLPENFKLVLAGPTITASERDPGMTQDQVPEFLIRIKSMNLSDRVKVVPTFVDTAEYLSGADIFCFPAHNEAMGTPLLEALVSGTPVIANAQESSFKEWIINGENGFLVDMSPSKWAAAVTKLGKFNAQKRQEISKSISEKVHSDTIHAQYFQLLTELSNTPAGKTLDVKQVLSS